MQKTRNYEKYNHYKKQSTFEPVAFEPAAFEPVSYENYNFIGGFTNWPIRTQLWWGLETVQ